ncbi:hypothetical protein C8R43DRAFT_959094 [Mycena crocata]|nr:hypothetical protein C8R43DRAFT_959094 [Mycena crocata]
MTTYTECTLSSLPDFIHEAFTDVVIRPDDSVAEATLTKVWSPHVQESDVATSSHLSLAGFRKVIHQIRSTFADRRLVNEAFVVATPADQSNKTGAVAATHLLTGMQDGKPVTVTIVAVLRIKVSEVKIIRVELDTAEETQIFEQLLPVPRIWGPIILGSFFLLFLRGAGHNDGVMLVNWRTRTHAALECVYQRGLEAILLPENIIIASTTSPPASTHHFGLYTIISLVFTALPSSGPWDLVFSTGMQPLELGNPLPDATETISLDLYAFKSPLRRDAHTVILQICDLFPGPESQKPIGIMSRLILQRKPPRRGYRSTLFKLSGLSSTPIWKMLCSVPHPTSSYQLLSASAYLVQRGSVWDALPVRDGFTSREPRQVMSENSPATGMIYFSPSGGALVAYKDGTVAVVYFQ